MQDCSIFIANALEILQSCTKPSIPIIPNGPLTRWVKLRVAPAPGMRGTFSPPPTSKETPSWRSRNASRHVHHARAVMHVGIANPRWRGKRSRHSRRMRNPQFYVSGKRPIRYAHGLLCLVYVWLYHQLLSVWFIYPYHSILLHRHMGNHIIAQVSLKESRRMCVEWLIPNQKAHKSSKSCAYCMAFTPQSPMYIFVITKHPK